MEYPSTSTAAESKSLSSFGTNSEQSFEQITEVLPNEPIYAKLGNDYKGGTETGYHDNLLTKQQALNHVRQGGNVGVKLGDWFDGITFVNFDIEEKGTLPEDIRSVIDTHAVMTWDSPHGGYNRLVKIAEREAYDLLRSYPTTITDITDNGLDDLEILTKNHAVIPPSSIDHTQCSANKADERDCPGRGTDRYVLQSVSFSEPLSVSTVERLGDLLQLEPTKVTQPTIGRTEEVTDVASPTPAFNPWNEFQNHVPHVTHGFDERKEYMMYGDWKGQDRFIRLYNGDFTPISGSNKQGRAECAIANYVGFFFGRNEKFVRHFMSTLPFETYYEQYPKHRKTLLDFATSVDWCYCEGVSFDCKLGVATGIWTEGRTTTQELVEVAGLERTQIQRTLPILKAEGVIETHTVEHGKQIITNEGIAEGYLLGLQSVTKKYEGNEQNGSQEVAIDRVQI